MEPIPTNWLETLDSDLHVVKWRSSSKFDLIEIEGQLRFISLLTPEAFERVIGTDTSMPQSYPHWWCYARLSRATSGEESPKYPLISKWKQLLTRHHSKMLRGPLTDFTVISVLKTWLEQLYVDTVLFHDESVRWNVPRLYGDVVLCNGKADPGSRSATVLFIQKLGVEIFKERGFKEGQEYWSEICKQYTMH